MDSYTRQRNYDANDPYYHNGACPECRTYDVCLNVRKNQYVVCHEHKVFWWNGYGLSSGWL